MRVLALRGGKHARFGPKFVSFPPLKLGDVRFPPLKPDGTGRARRDRRASPSARAYRGVVRTRRYPNFVAFIVTGAIVGAITGGLISVLSPNESVLFSERSALTFMALSFGLLGAFLGAVVSAVTDVVLERRAR